MEALFLPMILILGLIVLFKSIRIVNQNEKGLILRLGKYRTTASPGLNFLFPFIEAMIFVDMREKVINVEPQKVITQDNVSVVVDAAIYFKVVDPVKAEFEVENFNYAVTTLAQTNLRNLIGDKTLDQTLTARDLINTNLREVIDEATDTWGVKVTRVEVQKIDPPTDITDAMSMQMKAEREKRAVILDAEGIKQSQVLQAQGKKDAAILEAEGLAQAALLKADAEAKAITKVADAANKHFKANAQAWRQMEVSERVLDGNTKYVIPSNADVLNVLNLEGDNGKSKTKVVPVKR